MTSDETRSAATGSSLARRILAQPFRDLRAYRLGTLRRDGVAGLSVAVVAVPQSLAYAAIAGVPPEVGVHTLVVQSTIAALVGSQPFLSTGPINTQSLLVAAVATRVLQASGVTAPGADATALYLQLVVALTLLKGVVQIGLAVAGFARLVRYVSASVILGFTAGAGVLIAAGQLAPFLGVGDAPVDGAWPGLVGELQQLAAGGPPRGASIGIGVACVAAILAARRISPLVPGPLVAVALGAVAVSVAGLSAADLPLVPPVAGHLPALRLPSLDAARAESLASGAFALAVLGMMESWSIAKTLAVRSGQRISPTQELVAQGVANAASSFFGCIPGSGSFSRSALNVRAGAATRYAGLFNAAFSAAMLFAFAPLAASIPQASLAAVLFVIAYDLVDWRTIARVLRTSRTDASVCLTTLAATLSLPLAYAVFVGVFLNIALYLRRASMLHLDEMISRPEDPAGSFVERPFRAEVDAGAAPRRDVVFLQLQGDLFFGQADELEERLARLATGDVRVVVLRLKRTHSIDSTVLAVLDRFARALAQRGAHLLLCGAHPGVTRALRAYGVLDTIGEDGFFEATPGVFASARRALARARELAGREIDESELDEDALEPD